MFNDKKRKRGCSHLSASSSSVFDIKMLLLARLLHTHQIRRFSGSRDFFANLKKYYRSTTSDLYMASDRSPSQTCFVFDKDEGTKILIQMTYEIPFTTIRRKFNLLRSADESVSQTVRRLTANIDRAAKKESKLIKRRQIDGASQSPSEPIVIQLFDDADQPIDESRNNKQAWLNCRKLRINDQPYDVEYNAPGKRMSSPTRTHRHVPLPLSSNHQIPLSWCRHDQYDHDSGRRLGLRSMGTFSVRLVRDRWSESTHERRCRRRRRWYPMDARVSRSSLHLSWWAREQIRPSGMSTAQRCIAARDARRAHIESTNYSVSSWSADDEKTPIDGGSSSERFRCVSTSCYSVRSRTVVFSSSLRLLSYNILAKGYASSTGAAETFFPYCPEKFIDHDYRKPLLLREILGWHRVITLSFTIDLLHCRVPCGYHLVTRMRYEILWTWTVHGARSVWL